MTKDQIEEKTIDIVAGIFGVLPEKISRQTRFIEDLRAKSIDTMALLAAFEGEFGIKIPASEIQGNQTVGQAIDYIMEKTKPAPR